MHHRPVAAQVHRKGQWGLHGKQCGITDKATLFKEGPFAFDKGPLMTSLKMLLEGPYGKQCWITDKATFDNHHDKAIKVLIWLS